ncbi:MAG: hypothetical protein ACXACB_05885, partial [Promethearchaeota archaeon]
MSDEREIPLYRYVIYILAAITVSFIIIRIISYFNDITPWVKATKDIDFRILIEGMKNGLIDFYDYIPISNWPPYYLYFWYFIFFPIFIIPFEGLISIYIWDFLRLLLTIIVVKESSKLFKNKKDLLIFYIFGTIGYSIDAYYNNVNFIIVFLL